MTHNAVAIIETTLDDNKAENITIIDVSERTQITDYMVIATARSVKHAEALADKIVVQAKQDGNQPISSLKEAHTGWVLVDLNNMVVHIMTQEMRDLYNLERLWSGNEPSPATPE